ncbi:MAG: SAM-dependent methyltransferase [Lachnospiraceae bacterium]|nr:SAM-dependent methyltransferase [Lachnospiraceae bacterium]
MKLSRRLLAVAQMVPTGSILCDVGCDHAYLPIYLIREKICPQVIAMDVKEEPCRRAAANVEQAGLSDRILLRRSDGLSALKEGEADTVVLAGMGGALMRKILEEGFAYDKGIRHLILEPQSEVAALRKFLRMPGKGRRPGFFSITDEKMVEENGHFYPVIALEAKAEETSSQMEDSRLLAVMDAFGPVLLRKKDPVLKKFLQREERKAHSLLEDLRKRAVRENRMRELTEELAQIQLALSIVRDS